MDQRGKKKQFPSFEWIIMEVTLKSNFLVTKQDRNKCTSQLELKRNLYKPKFPPWKECWPHRKRKKYLHLVWDKAKHRGEKEDYGKKYELPTVIWGKGRSKPYFKMVRLWNRTLIMTAEVWIFLFSKYLLSTYSTQKYDKCLFLSDRLLDHST